MENILKKLSKIKPFINKYDWEGINYPLEKDDWKKFDKNNPTIVLNVLHAKKGKIYSAYISKQTQSVKNVIPLKCYSFNDSKGRSMTLYYSKKTISIIKRNNIKRCWRFLLFELCSFV